jgi:hypothetical protein
LEEIEYLASKMRFPVERMTLILTKMASLDAIDKELYSHGLIWSQNLVTRIAPVYKTRGQKLPPKPDITYFHPMANLPDNPVSLPDNPVSLPDNPVSLPDSTQSKLYKTKEKKIREDNKEIFSLPEWIPVEVWNAFIEMRIKKKKPATDWAKKLIINKLTKFKNDGENITDILNKSILKTWEDVYSLQNNGGNGHERTNGAYAGRGKSTFARTQGYTEEEYDQPIK